MKYEHTNYLGLHSDVLATALFLILSATYAAFFGFISPDSWEYVHLAQSLVDGRVCEVDWKYFAIFPCGYPITLALSSFSQDSATIISVSKFTNAVLLLASFLCFRHLFSRNQLVAVLIIIAPSTISISHYTWSENLFLFATALSLRQLDKIATKQSYISQLLLLLALLIGISSRYFFAPFAVLIWLSTLVIYGGDAARRTLPVFVIAGIAFISYYLLNIELSGYGTGIPRNPAPESFPFLTVLFFWELLHGGMPFVLFLFFFFLLTKKVTVANKPTITSLKQQKGVLLVFVAGFSFLLLSFGLRAKTQFDLYDFRTVGYGLTFMLVAGYALITESKRRNESIFLAVIFASLVSFGFAKRGDLEELANTLFNSNYFYHSISSQIYEYRKLSDVKGFDNVVWFTIPNIGRTIAGNPRYYYGEQTRLIAPGAAPHKIPEQLDSFLSRVISLNGSCVVDFKVFITRDQFLKHMQSSFGIDLIFDANSYRLRALKALGYNEELANFLIEQYEHQKAIECSKLLGKLNK